MLCSHPTRWILALVCGASLAAGCATTTDTPQGETGSLSVDLVIADGIVINQVEWQITGNGMDMSSTIDVSAPGSTASVEVFGLPPGEEDYTVTLTAESEGEQVSCRGSADFNVEIGQTTDVMVVLNCKLPRRLGAVRVNGEFNICAELIKAVVSPLQTSVGNDIDVSAQAVDQEGDPITFSWTGSGGSFADASASATTYTCQEVGDHEISISVTDNDEYCDMATWTVPVTCVPGDGGTGGTGGTGGDGGAAGGGGTGGDGGTAGGGGSVDPCEGKDCSDGNECTDDVCTDGVCSNPPVTDGTMCDNDMGTCQMGVCQPDDLCEGKDCSDGNECTADLCADGVCSNPPVTDGTMCDNDTGTCQSGVCEPVDPCEGLDCSDGNECTADLCADGICSNPPVTDGTMCNDDAGTCQDGMCQLAPAYINAGTDDTGYRAGPRICPASPGGAWPYITSGTSPTGTCALCLSNSCSGGTNATRACTTAADCPGGNCIPATPGPQDCALDCFTYECLGSATILFPGGGPQGACSYPATNANCPVLGCQVVSNTLKNQLGVDTLIFLQADSAGQSTRELTLSYEVQAYNNALGLAAALAAVNDVTVISDLTNANPSTMTNKLDPALAGDDVSDFLVNGVFIIDPAQLLPETQVVTPSASPVSVSFDETALLLELVIKSSGAPLDITGASCTFSNEAGTCIGGQNSLRACDPSLPNGGTGLSDCSVPDIFGTPGVCVNTGGTAISLLATIP